MTTPEFGKPHLERSACGYPAKNEADQERHLEKSKADLVHREQDLATGPIPDEVEDRYVEDEK